VPRRGRLQRGLEFHGWIRWWGESEGFGFSIYAAPDSPRETAGLNAVREFLKRRGNPAWARLAGHIGRKRFVGETERFIEQGKPALQPRGL